MNPDVWMSAVTTDSRIGMKQGLRAKFYDKDWDPASLIIPMLDEPAKAAAWRYTKGETLERMDFTEAAAVWDEARFGRTRDLFAAGPFYAVKGRLAEVLSKFDLGRGGLIPFTIYKADLVTPFDGEFFLLNFGEPKDTLSPEQSNPKCLQALYVDKKTGQQVWTIEIAQHDDVALLPSARQGADIWCEQTVYRKMFMSGRLVEALKKAKVKVDFRLTACRIASIQ